MSRGRKEGTEQPLESAHYDARKQLWKKALATGEATVAEIRRCAVDPESQDLLQMSLRLAGVRILMDTDYNVKELQ